MSHIVIQNRGELPIWGMRLLGLSNKNEDQIGQFGTGLKESIALLARMDCLPIIYSGTCEIRFEIRGTPDELHFQLSEQRDQFSPGQWYGLGMHPDFGKADWDNPWMVFREIICNALDESGTEDLYHDVISTEPNGVEGATRIFIPTSPALLGAYSSVQNKLISLGSFDVIAEYEDVGSLLAKKERPQLQIFYRGVWVQEGSENSLYDYELEDLKLNESRSADWYYVKLRMARIIARFGVEQATNALGRFMDHPDEEYAEKDAMRDAANFANVAQCKPWVEAFYNVFGASAVMCVNEKFFHDRLEEIGKKPVVVAHDGLYGFLRDCGVPCASHVLTEDQKNYEVLEQPSPEAQAVFNEVWAKFEELGIDNGKDKPGLMLFKQRPGMTQVVFGEYRAGICHINLSCIGSSHERVACIEEIAHHVTGAADHSKEFQHFLVESLESAMFTEKRQSV